MYPKQFLSLLHDETMLQKTLSRLDGLEHAAPTIVCNNEHRFIVAEQARQSGVEDLSIILEPFGRNTAPAIAVAALHALQHAQDPVLLVLSADHEIADEKSFCAAVRQAQPLAEAGKLVTFGIVPDHAATGYGYIKRGESFEQGYIVDKFVEKPDHATAAAYLDSGDYYWNSGMFMFKAQVYLDELGKFNRGNGKNPACLRGADGRLLERYRQLEIVMGARQKRRLG
jgi:mannose-1-phosphate guanylyltransferase